MIGALVLAAGLGTRLRPYTDEWPKCLMPISGKPLLEIWLDQIFALGIRDVLVNVHYLKEKVFEFLDRPKFQGRVQAVFEPVLLGTAGTLLQNYKFFKGKTTLLVHGDNLCACDFRDFIDYHLFKRPSGTLMTMMTFRTDTPRTCGIVELDELNIVRNFYEKIPDPPGNLANAAIYLISPELLEWLHARPEIHDFSNQVLPKFLGKIATWENKGIMRDIGNQESLMRAQGQIQFPNEDDPDEWLSSFRTSSIFKLINSRS
ncbi:nucleotidyl transferase [Leptospira inadai serovar Lyme str. 10]|uniref:Nucleotidyl transferase n=2 Tax=Leptospira inadai serovar Lyme TaxID=293084 RepID=V6HCJ8_9LEPT|nr:nucleotidyltransferase family protein [Leptospira inadai]EQA36608.1 nucleotidyl transferase [Leptospira inadai serovar Lyme str. 10]PNV76492.1 mannose-1-phosphate guanylyltransferase [Leptospira inadai serovar Lyme]